MRRASSFRRPAPALLLVAGLALCAGPAAAAAPAPVALEVSVREGPDAPARTATLRCVGARARATGNLGADARGACAAARELAGFLAAPPEPGRACTDVYGGPQTARVRGHAGRWSIDRRLSREDGCALEDWERAARLLGPIAAHGRLLVAYSRSGGIAGFDDRLDVSRAGVAVITRRGGPAVRVLLSPKELAELERVLEAADFPSLEPEYLPTWPVADGFAYAVTYRGRTVRAADDAVPSALVPVLAALDSVVARSFGSSAVCPPPGVDPRVVLCPAPAAVP